MEQTPDETLYELTVTACADGDLLLEQGLCWSCDEHVPIRLHRSHLALLGTYAALVPVAEVERATDRLRDRLTLMASLVRTLTQPGDPLRLVIEDLMLQEGIGHESRAVVAFSPDAEGDAQPLVSNRLAGILNSREGIYFLK